MNDWPVYALFGAMAVLLPASVAILYSVHRRRKEQRLRRALQDAPRVKVREVKEGQVVKVVGRLTYAGEPLSAPVSGRTCAAWHAEVWVSGGQDEMTIPERIEDQRTQDFLLTDGTGTALVRPAFADLVIKQDARFRSGTFHSATPRLEAFLSRHGQSSMGTGWHTKDIDYREGVLEEGEFVAVLARGRWEIDPHPGSSGERAGYRGEARRLVLVPPAGARMILSDHPDTRGSPG